MAQQLVTRIDDRLAADLEAERRRRVGEAIVGGYERIPPTDDDAAWSDDATVRMIAEEPW
jgi:hypothetical protein